MEAHPKETDVEPTDQRHTDAAVDGSSFIGNNEKEPIADPSTAPSNHARLKLDSSDSVRPRKAAGDTRNVGGMTVAVELTRSPQSRWTVWVPQYLATQLFRISSIVRSKAANAGEIADFTSWISDTFGHARLLSTREQLWQLLAQRVGNRPVHGIEFGVAHGYSTYWWLRRLPGGTVSWDGFDRFTGLPRAWRGLDEGAFDAGGQPPAIEDHRVTWHVGNVEDTLAELVLDRSDPPQLIILFDLDIFEPSLAAWEHVRHALRPGDLLYFDEAFDQDERRLLTEYVLHSGSFTCVGWTPTALALEVQQIHAR
jgi:hypothetical protein